MQMPLSEGELENKARASGGSFQCSQLPRRERKTTGIFEILAVFESNII